MRFKILIDNISGDELTAEWGLAVWIEYEGHQFLLDTGTTGSFAANAEAVGVKLEDVEIGVLSHAHFDHSDGLEEFFARNQRASFYMRKGTKENCYSWKETDYKYIGIRQGMLERYRDRIVYVDGDHELQPGVWLIPHKTPGLEKMGQRAKQFVKIGHHMKADDFQHEQSLVFDTEQGLVIFNSCCHGGADTIIREVGDTFPGKKILALIGGFHLYRSAEEEVRRLAADIRETGIHKIVTGHCTGQEAFQILKEELGDMAEQMYAGMEMNLALLSENCYNKNH